MLGQQRPRQRPKVAWEFSHDALPPPSSLNKNVDQCEKASQKHPLGGVQKQLIVTPSFLSSVQSPQVTIGTCVCVNSRQLDDDSMMTAIHASHMTSVSVAEQ